MSLLQYAHQRLEAMQCAGLSPLGPLDPEIKGLLSLLDASERLSKGMFFLANSSFRGDVHEAMQYLPVAHYKLAETPEDLFGEKVCIYVGQLRLTKTLYPCRGIVTLYDDALESPLGLYLSVCVKFEYRKDLPNPD